MRQFIVILIFVSSIFFIECNFGVNSKEVVDANDLPVAIEEAIVVEEVEPIDTFSFKDFNTVAYILAGEEVNYDTKYSNLIESYYFQEHKNHMSKIWKEYEQTLDNIDDWRKVNIPNADTIFYPFGGPDFNYIASFFPDSKFSILIGLEDCGEIPFSNYNEDKNYSEALQMISKTIKTNINYSFFRTYGMRDHFKTSINGTLPIIMMYLVKHNYEIVNINPVKVDYDGSIVYTDEENIYAHTLDKDFAKAFEIIYKDQEVGDLRKVIYLSMNLEDNKIDKESFKLMMDKYFNNCTSFLKAASYLLDTPNFSFVRDLILDYSKHIVTGPSGVQYRDFNEDWDIKLFGRYIGPIRLFSTRLQSDLIGAYQDEDPDILKFRFDYDLVNSSLIVATKKN